MRGGEKVLDAICELFPDAPLYTLVRVPGSVSARIEARPIRTSFVAGAPRPGRFYRHYLPLYPLAVELLDFSSVRPGHQQQPLRGEVGHGAGRARFTSATATRRCGMPGISSTPTSARLRSGR